MKIVHLFSSKKIKHLKARVSQRAAVRSTPLRCTPAKDASKTVVELAQQKIAFIQLKEDAFREEITARKAREVEVHKLQVESLKLDLKFKRLKVRNIALKNRALMLYCRKVTRQLV